MSVKTLVHFQAGFHLGLYDIGVLSVRRSVVLTMHINEMGENKISIENLRRIS